MEDKYQTRGVVSTIAAERRRREEEQRQEQQRRGQEYLELSRSKKSTSEALRRNYKGLILTVVVGGVLSYCCTSSVIEYFRKEQYELGALFLALDVVVAAGSLGILNVLGQRGLELFAEKQDLEQRLKR
ncbi:MAG: hypothetical protein V2A62_00275 [Candidatus Woesearchaeota archaeon]